MSIELILYFIDLLKGVKNILEVISLIFLMASLICWVLSFLADGEEQEKISPYGKICFKWFLIIGILWASIPSPSTMYMMVGTRYLKDSNLPAKVEELLNKKIDELLQDK